MNNLTKIAALPMAGGAMAALPAETHLGKPKKAIRNDPVEVFVPGPHGYVITPWYEAKKAAFGNFVSLWQK